MNERLDRDYLEGFFGLFACLHRTVCLDAQTKDEGFAAGGLEETRLCESGGRGGRVTTRGHGETARRRLEIRGQRADDRGQTTENRRRK